VRGWYRRLRVIRHAVHSCARSGHDSSRAILFDKQGQIAGVAQHEFPQIFPAAGWVEHDPLDILTSQLSAAVEVLGKSRGDAARRGGAGDRKPAGNDHRVGSRNGQASVERDCVAGPADRRRCARVLREEGVEETVRQKTGLPARPYFSATKIAWILDNVEGVRARAEKGEAGLGTVDSWLIWNLTNGKRHVTDRTNASRTLLYNIVEDRWDEELLRIFGISRKHDAGGGLVRARWWAG